MIKRVLQLNIRNGELFKKVKDELKHLYMIDVICDENLVPYYEKQGLTKSYGAILRNYENQNGEVS